MGQESWVRFLRADALDSCTPRILGCSLDDRLLSQHHKVFRAFHPHASNKSFAERIRLESAVERVEYSDGSPFATPEKAPRYLPPS